MPVRRTAGSQRAHSPSPSLGAFVARIALSLAILLLLTAWAGKDGSGADSSAIDDTADGAATDGADTPPQIVRFIVEVCKAKADDYGDGCDFVLYLADNFYDDGVSSVDDEQLAWLDSDLAMSTSTRNIAFGHHPYLSNGQHGKAGEYEGYEWLPIANGEAVKSFMEDGVCGQIDLYLSGHDHDRQWLEPDCGTE